MLDSLSPQRKRFVAGSAGLAIALVAVVAVLAMRPNEPAARRGWGIPVLLVHGYGGSPSSMATLAAALHNLDRKVLAVTLPQHGEGEIGRSAHVLGQAVDRTGAARVDLVGFSAGSIVVRAYVATAAGSRTARRVVLLGAPNHGADIASLAVATDPSACVDACAELARGSGFLRSLNSKPLPDHTTFVSIWSQQDMVVTPPDSAVLPGAANIKVQSVCPRANLAHGDLVTDPVAIGLTIVALRGERGILGCRQIRALGLRALTQ